MPSANLRKSDKKEAIEEMVKSKFKKRYDKLMKRRTDLALRVYDETYGVIGNKLEAAAGKRFNYWLDTTSSLPLEDVSVPRLITPGPRPSAPDMDFFTRRSHYKVRPENFGQTLPRQVVKPDREYGFCVKVADAKSGTKRVAKTLEKDISEFNQEIDEFYRQADYILRHIRTTKQVDERLPELWEFMPDGLRERIKQAVVVIDQDHIDSFRDRVKQCKKLK